MATKRERKEPTFDPCHGISMSFRLKDTDNADEVGLPTDGNVVPAFLQDIRNEIVNLRKEQVKHSKALTRLNTILTEIFGSPKEGK